MQMMISAAKENDSIAAADADDSGVELGIARPVASGVLEPQPEPETHFHEGTCASEPMLTAQSNNLEHLVRNHQENADFACEQAAIRAAMNRRRNARQAASAEAQVQVEDPVCAER
eukprot:COSAG02_NODE_2399_length_8948_cov_21.873771_6_plen_116_part_00